MIDTQKSTSQTVGELGTKVHYCASLNRQVFIIRKDKLFLVDLNKTSPYSLVQQVLNYVARSIKTGDAKKLVGFRLLNNDMVEKCVH